MLSEMVDELHLRSLTLSDSDGNVLESDVDCLFAEDSSFTMLNNTEIETFKSIKLIGYRGALLAENEFKTALEEGPKNIEFTKLVSFLANELRVLCNLDECVNAIATPEDSVSFIMETSSFLKELGCPHSSLLKGHVSDRFSTPSDRILLVEYLATELMAMRIFRENRPEKKIELKLQESSQAADLRKILQILGFPKPPANIMMQTLIQKLIPTVQNTVKKAHTDLIGNPIFNGTLSEKQWETLDNIQQELHDDYLIRREMLLTRLDCTIQSFQWSDKTKGKDDLFNKAYTEKRKSLKAEPDVDLSDLLASRDDLAIIEKTSNASVRKNTKSSINKVIIGQVPDRGGRTSELAPPPPEMPPWLQRSAGPSGGGGGGYRGAQQGGQSYRGGSNYSRGGGSQQNTYGSGQQNNYGGGNTYSSTGTNYSQKSNRGDYNNYSNDSMKGGNNRGFDSAGNYGRDSDYSRGGNDNQSRGSSSYGQSSGNYSGGYSQSSGSTRSGGYDSAGSYGGYNQDYQEPKRAKTYDQFQQNRETYADQYVQESQHNQQYHSRDRDNRSRGGRGGRSNYSRGGGRGGYR